MPIIKIKSISHENLVSKRTGKPWISCKITSVGKDGKDTILSGFGDDITKTLCAGDNVDLELSQNEKGYWNFKLAPTQKAGKTEIELLREINSKLDELIGQVDTSEPQKDELAQFGL